ncbi:NAD(P)/FAD-dependent oxidoreductase [Wenxinia saemankumensis]|uniref:Flavoprotein, HI0933 family n=1 Tax=Wenxinia saemankumensis TaxID=1447782 RepID=A0A1M6CI51_9RHOB|nr:aminoacetone oxidase family FAD-binding enzyme [Wenxinia saemankumensis]SHI60388.1 hypothetical protein SAMN05444417_1192 [Wenxinia saemankumensis]
MECRTLILGAGAAGLYAAARTGPDTLVLDHAKRPGEKIRISGGGRCNFTNTGTEAGNFLSANPHFAKSALARLTPWDFLAEVEAAGIAWHEKTLGQLFCDGSSRQIVEMLTGAAARAGAAIRMETGLGEVGHDGSRFTVETVRNGRAETIRARHLVVATGGKSIPRMGATGRGLEIARRFGLAVTETRPALVPFTFSGQPFAGLSGLSLPITARAAERGPAFPEAMLFTHRGLSGPALLQASNYWHEGEEIVLDLAGPGLGAALVAAKRQEGARALRTHLARHLPARLAEHLCEGIAGAGRPIADWPDAELATLADRLADWRLVPSGTEGYRTAEVMLGGVDTAGLSSKTMEAKAVPGLYFIGECVDVTGWLGGYNFQWAWASAAAAAAAIRDA